MHGETLCFLDCLFERCGTPGYITLSALPPDDTQRTPSRHVPIHDKARLIADLDDLQAANRLGWGAVFAVALRKADLGRWRRGGKSDLAQLPAIFMDCDHPGQLERLRSFWLPPSCLVSSAWGIHAYWLLDKPTRNFASAESIMRGLAQNFGGDSVTSSAHSLRIPGTTNPKVGRANFPCSLIELHPERRYALTNFSAYDLTSDQPRRAEMSHQTQPMPHLHQADHLSHDQVESAVRSVTDCLMHSYGGHVQRNGWISALCPFGHTHDRPGLHFGWSPDHRVARCFGRHGKVGLAEMCHQLGIHLPC